METIESIRCGNRSLSFTKTTESRRYSGRGIRRLHLVAWTCSSLPTSYGFQPAQQVALGLSRRSAVVQPSMIAIPAVVDLRNEAGAATLSTPSTSQSALEDIHSDPARDNARDADPEESVPTTLEGALRLFFLGNYMGPPTVVMTLVVLTAWRFGLPQVVDAGDAFVSCAAVVFWWFQEHALHSHLLHSTFDWIGKDIHENHHAKPYFHVSIDSAPLMLGWMFVVHVLLRSLLPLPLALSATVGYAAAGLFYEWAHYIVHTKVRFPTNSYWYRMKTHHIRHHCIDNSNWLGISVPAVDDLFGTNPDIRQVRRVKQRLT